MSQRLKREYGKSESNNKSLQNAFSLLAYSDPWNSPVGYQLDPVQREPVCAALNSAILESQGLPKQPPLELVIAQSTECMKLMSKAKIGSCAFANLNDYLHWQRRESIGAWQVLENPEVVYTKNILCVRWKRTWYAILLKFIIAGSFYAFV